MKIEWLQDALSHPRVHHHLVLSLAADLVLLLVTDFKF